VGSWLMAAEAYTEIVYGYLQQFCERSGTLPSRHEVVMSQYSSW